MAKERRNRRLRKEDPLYPIVSDGKKWARVDLTGMSAQRQQECVSSLTGPLSNRASVWIEGDMLTVGIEDSIGAKQRGQVMDSVVQTMDRMLATLISDHGPEQDKASRSRHNGKDRGQQFPARRSSRPVRMAFQF